MQHVTKETAEILFSSAKKLEDAQTHALPCLPRWLPLRMCIQVTELTTPTTEIIWSCTTCADLVRSPCSCTLYPAATNATATRERFYKECHFFLQLGRVSMTCRIGHGLDKLLSLRKNINVILTICTQLYHLPFMWGLLWLAPIPHVENLVVIYFGDFASNYAIACWFSGMVWYRHTYICMQEVLIWWIPLPSPNRHI